MMREWAREPTDAELSGYLPRNPPDGYGLVACKTMPERIASKIASSSKIPRRVRTSPRRSARPHGNSASARPRKGGRPLIGSWVRIRIDYSFVRTSVDRGL